MDFTEQAQDIALTLQLNANDEGEELSLYEALQIAVQVQRNEIIASAFVVNTGQNVPSALELIAMILQKKND